MGRKFTKKKPPRVPSLKGCSEEERKKLTIERKRLRIGWIRWNRMVDRINELREFIGIRRTRRTGEAELQIIEYFKEWHKYGDLDDDPTPCQFFKPWKDDPNPDAGANAIVV